MSRCLKCNVEIRDEAQLCPLCHCVLEQQGENENVYPNVRMNVKKIALIGRVYLFVFLVLSVGLVTANYELGHEIWWSAVAIAAMAYLYLILRFAVIEDTGYRAKIIVLTLCGILMVVLIDFVLGYRGWSVNYVIPSGILLVDAGIILLMFINKRNWQSYLLFQLMVILWSIAPLVLWWIGIVTNPIMSLISFGASVFLFLGTLIIGDRRARIELQRRFHVR